MNTEKEWIDALKLIPDFTVFGFHKNIDLEIRLTDENVKRVFYHGYGVFQERGKSETYDIERHAYTHWRPLPDFDMTNFNAIDLQTGENRDAKSIAILVTDNKESQP